MSVINHVIITGQSLAVQPNGASLSGTQTRPTEITYLSGGTRLPLERANQWPERSFADTAAPVGQLFNVRTGAVSGQPYTGLKKGTSTYTGNINNLSAGITPAASQGHSFVVRALLIMHGEADSVFGTSRSTYESYLNEWRNDYNTDVKTVTGQSSDIVAIAHQVSTKPLCAPAYAVLDAHRDRANSKVYAAGPIYQLQLDGAVHPDAANTFKMGELHARVYRSVVVDDTDWNPVAPTSVVRNGTVITVAFTVPSPPLVFDTTLFHARTNYGFGYSDDDSSAQISSIAIAGPTSITITLDQEPTGGNERLFYGPPASTFGGNLRDSESAVSTLDGGPMYNWCCYFDDPVTIGAVDPGSVGLVGTDSAPVNEYQRVNGIAVPLVDSTRE